MKIIIINIIETMSNDNMKWTFCHCHRYWTLLRYSNHWPEIYGWPHSFQPLMLDYAHCSRPFCRSKARRRPSHFQKGIFGYNLFLLPCRFCIVRCFTFLFSSQCLSSALKFKFFFSLSLTMINSIFHLFWIGHVRQQLHCI